MHTRSEHRDGMRVDWHVPIEMDDGNVLDAEVPHGYVVVRVDSRGAGWSPGYLDPRSPREIADFARCIEWAGTQPWSSGKVGLCGISYYAVTQWLVAHADPDDRPPDVFDATVTLHTTPAQPSYLLLPVIPFAEPGSTKLAHGRSAKGSAPLTTAQGACGPETPRPVNMRLSFGHDQRSQQ